MENQYNDGKDLYVQEKLDDAGENLPELYKWLEKQVPERCTTEAWRKRTHWAGLMPTTEVFEAVKMAEKELTAQRPVRRCTISLPVFSSPTCF